MSKPIQVGDLVSHERECHKYQPLFYAGASGDFNPIHIDPEVGEAAGLGGTILQGLCTLAWAVESAALLTGGDPGKVKKVRVRFSRPVKIGDVIRFAGKVKEQKENRFTVDLTAKNQDGEDVLKGASAEVEP